MLDPRLLQTPEDDGGILVAPAPLSVRSALDENASALSRLDLTLAGVPLAEHRRQLRTTLADDPDRPLIVTGHQPEFIHPGVWAKHVVAARLAEAAGGSAVNLIVDSDIPKDTVLPVPGVRDGAVRLTPIRLTDTPVGVPFEHFPAYGQADVTRLRGEVSDAMNDRFAASLIPDFLDALRADPHARDWVAQVVFARRALERSLGVELREHRVSEVWFGPLLAEMIANAHRFAACYNSALAEYRHENRVRGCQRPIPDLTVDGPRCEVAAWVHDHAGRRRRLYVERVCDVLRLFADNDRIGECPAETFSRWDRAEPALRGLPGYYFRPRALTLTLWARLCLADLFIHGIGGAKYDRITDRLMMGYFGMKPPAIACVSATLRLGLPHPGVGIDGVRANERRLRDLRHNPQRHLTGGDEIRRLASRRSAAVAESLRLRREQPVTRATRRRVFDEIRSVSAQMLAERPTTLKDYEATLEQTRQRREESAIALRRDYFIGLFTRQRLELLLERLPAAAAFRV